MFKKLILIVALLFVTFTLSACSFNWPWQKNKPEDVPVVMEPNVDDGARDNELTDSAYQIKKFANYEELKEFIKSKNNTRSEYYSDSRSAGEDLFASSASLDSGLSTKATNLEQASFGATESSNDYSRTNLQVAGVDEADVIKTDGKYVYLLSKDRLFIVDAVPATKSKIVSTISFDVEPVEIYLDGTRLVVISVGENEDLAVEKKYYDGVYQSYLDFTYVDVFDISNIEEPKKIRQLSFEGSYLSSRAINGKLYLVSNNEELNEEDILPIVFDGEKMLGNDCSLSVKCYSPDVYYFNDDEDYYSLTSINSIDMRGQGDIVSSQAYLVNNENFNIYASLNNLYLTHSELMNINSIFMPELLGFIKSKLDPVNKEAIDKIEAENPNDTEKVNQESEKIISEYLDSLSKEESESIQAEFMEVAKNFLLREVGNIEKTVIHKLSLNEGLVSYETSASVSGQTLNQFSLDEDENGNLRIATTNRMMRDFGADDLDVPSSYSNLFVLSPSLEVLGSITKIAADEKIYSARFLGQRAYLVTFEVIDPLFVIDLSSPSQPELLGELKVPGYSTYLHPYDENTLIGLGRDTRVNEYGGVINEGVKLSLFDVKDPANPRELDSFVAGTAGSDSIALYNHKAFLFSKEKNLLLVPAFLRNFVDDNGKKSSVGGAMVFSIDNYKFNLRGIIDHSDNGQSSPRDYSCGDVCYDNTVQRGLYINDVVYTFSNRYLKANNLKDLQPLSSLILTTKTIEEENISERDARRVSDVKQLQTAVELYYNDMGHYPQTQEVISGKPLGINESSVYLAIVPTPPVPVDGDNCPSSQPAYTYISRGTSPQTYTINYCLGTDFNSIKGNRLQTATPAGIMLPGL